MLINLKTSAALAGPEEASFDITERIPANIEGPCHVVCRYTVCRGGADYFLLTLDASSELSVICQRCLNRFPYHYANQTQIAVCESDGLAGKLMSDYESIVSKNNQVDLLELVTDELYLYVPENHPDVNDCSKEVNIYLKF